MGIGAEDPFIWQEGGKFKALMLDTDRRYSSDKEIFYAVSNDGMRWRVPRQAIAVSREVLWADGTRRRMNSTERPHVLIDNGKPHTSSSQPEKRSPGRDTPGTWYSAEVIGT
jgi:hypothetical protein